MEVREVLLVVVASKAGGEGLLEDKTEESHSTIEVALRPPAVALVIWPASVIILLEVVQLGWWYDVLVVVVGLPASVVLAASLVAISPEAILIIIPGTSSSISLFS